MEEGYLRRQIIDTLNGKSEEKLKCYKKTLELFQMLKNDLHEMSGDINEEINNSREIKVEYRDRGRYEAQLLFADDLLLFNMHTNVFQFPENSPIHSQAYASQSKYNTICGVINIYNFLSESFKKNRPIDEGYLIGRIFINKDGYFFAEGDALEMYNYTTFGTRVMTEEVVVEIIEVLMLFSMNFELLVPPFDKVCRIEVEQFNTKMENNKIGTGKRLGYDL